MNEFRLSFVALNILLDCQIENKRPGFENQLSLDQKFKSVIAGTRGLTFNLPSPQMFHKNMQLFLGLL